MLASRPQSSSANRDWDRLVELGYIREHRLATGGRQAKGLEPLDEGRDALAEFEGGAA